MGDHVKQNNQTIGCGALSPDLEANFLDVISGQTSCASLEAHRAECEICDAELAELVELERLLSSDGVESLPGVLFFEALHSDIMDALPEQGQAIPSLLSEEKRTLPELSVWQAVLNWFESHRTVGMGLGVALALALIVVWAAFFTQEDPLIEGHVVAYVPNTSLSPAEVVELRQLADQLSFDSVATSIEGEEPDDIADELWVGGVAEHLGALTDEDVDVVLAALDGSL